MTTLTDNQGPELMFEMLNFARLNERKIYEDQLKLFKGDAQKTLQRLLIGEYLRKTKDTAFYTITSKGLNLFGDLRKEQPVPESMKTQIVEELKTAMAELEVKPWEVKFYIIHIIGEKKKATTEDLLTHFSETFPEIRGTSKPNVYRAVKHLRMKGYIEYEKEVQLGQSEYRLSEKGKEIFAMTKADAAHRLRTSEEWETALSTVFQRMAEERKTDDGALFDALKRSLPPALDEHQLVWVLYMQGSVYELKGSFDEAEEMYLRMEELCEEFKDNRGRAYALKGLGNAAFKRGKHDIAEQYYKKCQRIAADLRDDLLLSDVLNNLGSCLYMDDDVDEALNTFEKALELAKGDNMRTASTLYNEGLCYARKEDYEKARELWLESQRLYGELQEKVAIKKVEHNLREITRKQKEEYLREAYRRALETGTSAQIEKAYKELAAFLMDDLKKRGG